MVCRGLRMGEHGRAPLDVTASGCASWWPGRAVFSAGAAAARSAPVTDPLGSQLRAALAPPDPAALTAAILARLAATR